MPISKFLATLFVLLLVSFTVQAQPKSRAELSASLSGTYVAKYGLFNRHAVDFRLIPGPVEQNGGQIIISLSEYPEFGICRGTYALSPLHEEVLALYTQDQLHCQGLLDANYSWMSFVIEFPYETLINTSAAMGKMQIQNVEPDFKIRKKVYIEKR